MSNTRINTVVERIEYYLGELNSAISDELQESLNQDEKMKIPTTKNLEDDQRMLDLMTQYRENCLKIIGKTTEALIDDHGIPKYIVNAMYTFTFHRFKEKERESWKEGLE